MSYIEDLPKKKKIQDFFSDGDPERATHQEERKVRIPADKQNRKKVVTYLDDDTYNLFKKYCAGKDMKPSLVLRHLVKKCLNQPC